MRNGVVIGIVLALGVFVYIGMFPPFERDIASFEECVAAGNPILEIYPEQCITSDGMLFIRELDESLDTSKDKPSNLTPNEPMFCTQEAKQCSDGSFVGRTGPNCEFTQCP